jgi:LPS O-antigen subunit length determinant protein (WzzB/FepE family)
MLSTIVGNVDSAAAAVLVALFLGLGIAFSVYRTTPRKTKEEYDIDRMKLQQEQERWLSKYKMDNDYQIKQLEKGLDYFS